ncbi:MAG: 4a-hydroxytetrahydrobiopterin dehydratase [Candidatus Hydrogenedentes bacterium]|nr:4a-hydroxytetrahydrobiopterin dehydratase [Candidatus Hydrogenedentota bacterium]
MSTAELSERACVPCRGGVPPLRGAELAALRDELDSSWTVVDEHHLEKEFRFSAYRNAVKFANAVADIAEAVNHHPDILLVWGKVKVTVWTHKIDGLTESDFIFAAKVERASRAAVASESK